MQTKVVAGRVYNYSHNIGVLSVIGRGFYLPIDVALDKDQTIYVLNRGDDWAFTPRVTIVTFDEEFLGEFGSYGEADGQFIWPSGLALDNEANAYVSDDWLHRISIFDKKGAFLGKWGKPGPGDGELNGPSGLALDAAGDLYVSDTHNHRIQKFTKEGKFLLSWGGLGTGNGEFNLPWGIAIDGQGHIWVADWHNHRVQKFSADGDFLGSFGGPGDGPGQLNCPSGVAVDKEGDVYVADWGNNRVHIYNPQGTHIVTFTGDGEQLSKWGQQRIESNPDDGRAIKLAKRPDILWLFERPTAIAIGDHGEIIVTDAIRCRLQIYKKEYGFPIPQFTL